METVIEFRDSLLAYLNEQKRLEEEEIETNKKLSVEEKISAGLLIRNAVVASYFGDTYELSTSVDNTRLKAGDYVVVRTSGNSADAQVIDTALDSITIVTSLSLRENQKVDVEIKQNVFLDPIISLMKEMDEYRPGAAFLKQLAAIEQPVRKGLGGIDIADEYIPPYLNEMQTKVIADALLRPSVYCIQGPPGTGKTAVLATIASCFSANRKEVLIISNTHQAVNNALDKVVDIDPYSHPYKIGEAIKGEGLSDNVFIAETYNDYLSERRRHTKKRTCGDIVGMTLHSSVVNMGLRNSGFQPSIVLVDEAGQMPFAYASVIGAYGCGSVIFIGDDNQMPPIFHPQLVGHRYSKSIFEYLCSQYPSLRNTLNVTYRMNEEITLYVSSHFYECHGAGQKIIPSDSSKDRRFPVSVTDADERVTEALSPSQSIFQCDVTPVKDCQESNPYEADFAYRLVSAAVAGGMSPSDIAVITPYRRQVKEIRSVFRQHGVSMADTPLINTVECLQGQDVEMIIISFASTDKEYIKQHYDFILDRHRLNVMISRAKTKVVMLMDEFLKTF